MLCTLTLASKPCSWVQRNWCGNFWPMDADHTSAVMVLKMSSRVTLQYDLASPTQLQTDTWLASWLCLLNRVSRPSLERIWGHLRSTLIQGLFRAASFLDTAPTDRALQVAAHDTSGAQNELVLPLVFFSFLHFAACSRTYSSSSNLPSIANPPRLR